MTASTYDNDAEKVRKYRMCLNAFMSHQNSTPYSATHVFEENDLMDITPEEICKYFCKKIY